MSTPVTAHLDDDLYQDVIDEAKERDISNSRVVNEFARKGRHPEQEFDTCFNDEHAKLFEQHEELLAELTNDRERAIADGGTPTNSFWESLGQGLFIAGFLVALLAPVNFTSGVGMSMIGLGLMLWTKIQTHMQAGETLSQATKTTLGLN